MIYFTAKGAHFNVETNITEPRSLSRITGMIKSIISLCIFSLLSLASPWSSSCLMAQTDAPGGLLLQDEFQDLPGFGGGFDGQPEYTFSGDFTLNEASRIGSLNVTLEIKPDWHGYSQKKMAGQKPTKFTVIPSDQFKVTGAFIPNVDPVAKQNILDEPVEEFSGTVTWSAPIELAAGVNEKTLEIEVRVSGQVCNDKAGCIPFDPSASTVQAAFSKYLDVTTTAGETEFRAPNGHAEISGQLIDPVVGPGGKSLLKITAKMDSGWHIYHWQQSKPEKGSSIPTMIYFPRKFGWETNFPEPSKKPVKHEFGLEDEPFQYYHENTVTWTVELTAPEDIQGEFTLDGVMTYQVCDEMCDRPQTIQFKVPLKITDNPKPSDPVAIQFQPDTASAVSVSELSKKFWQTNDANQVSIEEFSLFKLATYLCMAFAAGLILNAMPCVLPVIGLKVMSFVQQAGESRLKIFMLNLVFSLGLMTVFWILATLAAFFGMGWGDWLTKSMTGSIIITSVVFAFGLSMLGVWEIPIPGLSGGSGNAGEEDGLMGAFLLGILTTVLATPCTGPMLVPATTIIAGQPAWVAYSVFTFLGLGMASPYLLIGLFPSAIKWLPRPGAWMNTFKQITGFILMGTVVFLLAAFTEEPWSEYMVAVMTSLLFISLGCWWIGRTSIAAELPDKLKAWSWGIVILGGGIALSFYVLVPPKYELDWQEFSKARLGELQAESRIVFIDFTGPN